MKGLGNRLNNGKMVLDRDQERVLILSVNGECLDEIRYEELTPSDWGYVYERHVSQLLKNDGYEVENHGLSKGYLDNGIDLIARREGKKIFIQCKYAVNSKLSKQRIEHILYKASSFLSTQDGSRETFFWLVVPSLSSAFSMKKTKSGKDYYPMAEYFLSKNNVQSRVKLEIHEISMQR